MNHTSGLVLAQETLDLNDSIEEIVLDTLCDMIITHGRPAAIYVRGEDGAMFLEDICEKIAVPLIQDKGVPAVDELLGELLKFMD